MIGGFLTKLFRPRTVSASQAGLVEYWNMQTTSWYNGGFQGLGPKVYNGSHDCLYQWTDILRPHGEHYVQQDGHDGKIEIFREETTDVHWYAFEDIALILNSSTEMSGYGILSF